MRVGRGAAEISPYGGFDLGACVCVIPVPTPQHPLAGRVGGIPCVPSVSSLQNPAVADIYTEHAHQVVVAKYAPSGFYIASGGTCVRACVHGSRMHVVGSGRPPGQTGLRAWEGRVGGGKGGQQVEPV